MPFPKIKKTSGVLSIWKTVIDLILSEPKVLIPFAIFAGVEVITLYLLASSSHFPVNIVLGPPIRRIWGEIYLHYPFIYELLPRIFYYANMVVSVVVGSVTSGMAVYMVFLFKKKEKPALRPVFFTVLKRYASLFILTVILFSAVHFLMKQPAFILVKYFRARHVKLLFLGPKFWFNVFLPVLNFILAVVLQGLFVYSIPYVVIKGKKFLSALISGMGLFFRMALKTLLVVIVPMCLYIPMTMLRSHLGFLADKFAPESIVVVLFLGILVGTIIVDCLITIATTLLFIEATHET